MRTPAQIARLVLGWPEAKAEYPFAVMCVRPGCGWKRMAASQEAASAVAAEHRHLPKLRIHREAPGWWCYDLDEGNGQGQGASAPTWGQALAVGLAALETASVGRV